MNRHELYGIVPALITPLNADFTLDIDALERLIEHQIGAGVHGLFVAGFTGEGAALTERNLRALMRHTKRIVSGRLPLCCGILEPGAQRTIETAKRLADEGFELLSTTVPFTPGRPSQHEILRHFELICNRTDAKWMVYGNSGSLTNIEPATFRALAQIGNVVAIKDTRPDFAGHLKNIMAVKDTGVSLLCGGEYLVGPGLLMGAQGNISGATNLFPKLFVDLYDGAKTGDVATVTARAEAIATIHSVTGGIDSCWLSAFKYIGQRMGLMQPWCLPPSQALTESHRRHIDQTLANL